MCARWRSQGCAKRTSKRLDLDGDSVSTIDEGLAISQTLVSRSGSDEKEAETLDCFEPVRWVTRFVVGLYCRVTARASAFRRGGTAASVD